MIYLNEDNLLEIGLDWFQLEDVIMEAIDCLDKNDFAQPIKPYLRYRDLTNRIIAMPAFAGGEINKSGIKWIASFPDNINNGIPRANAVSIINEADTGVPICIINTTLISAIRTAAVTGIVMHEFAKHRANQKTFNIGITGFGPIGQLHLDMVMQLLGNRVNKVSIFDIRPIKQELIPEKYAQHLSIVSSWEEAYQDADIFITCTVSKQAYVNLEPKKGSAHLNISLRDYQPEMKKYFNQIIVDDWAETCREKTDIEMMHLNQGLVKEDTLNLPEFIIGNKIKDLGEDETMMFNPMGLAVFDIAIGNYYYKQAQKKEIGTLLN